MLSDTLGALRGDLAGLLLFAGVYFLAVASPGPGLALIVARTLARGLQGLSWFIAGFVVGDLILFLLAASGLAVVARSFGEAFLAIRLAGAAYLLFLAWRMITQPAAPLEPGRAPPPEARLKAFLSSLSLTLGNPKAIVFFLSIMPLVVDVERLSLATLAQMALVLVLVIGPTLLAVALAAERARRLFRSAKAMRRLQQGTGVVMAGAAVAVATR